MKKTIVITICILALAYIANGQITECVTCKGNSIDFFKFASAVGEKNTSKGNSSFAGGFGSEAIGDYSFALGENVKATQRSSFATGYLSEASGVFSSAMGYGAMAKDHTAMAFGFMVEACAPSSFVTGRFVKANASNSIVIGGGVSPSYLINGISGSMMVGFNSIYPTLFISTSPSGGNKTGKIGIGNITTPEAKLHIKADDNENATLKLEITNSNYNAQLLLGDDFHKLSAKPNDDLKFTTPIGKNFVFENGNLGIGTDTPAEKLEVNGNIFQSPGFNISTNQIKATDLNSLKLTDQSGNGIFVKNGGNVGIGTNNPFAQLELVDFGDAGSMNLKIGDDIYLSDIDHDNTLGIYGCLDNTIGNIKLGSTGPKLYGKDGSLGIGTNEVGGCKLAVAGNIHAVEVLIEHADKWYDYVFEDDYDLTSLRDLEQYIGQNKHLPDVPSEKEVQENGINLGNMNGILLKKIEELTLYLIQQQKEIEKLKSQVCIIKNSNN